jgi:hypothetical protein
MARTYAIAPAANEGGGRPRPLVAPGPDRPTSAQIQPFKSFQAYLAGPFGERRYFRSLFAF